ncbi:MAG TPA: NlpC/P60 family protein [Patescibacteria group bacterium]|jgi:hypothetical protein|nr:NlpC/P60 family protein [Patescibacteria group bacterium]
MIYHAVGNLCAVNFSDLKLPISEKMALEILAELGFKTHIVDIVSLARECIKSSIYRRGVSASEAPEVVDCSSFMKWLYGRKGVWLPRHSIDQRSYLEVDVEEEDIIAGDLIFTTGFRNYFWADEDDAVGHVGIATGEGTAIHAANSKVGVIEAPIDRFLKKPRGVRRISENPNSIITIESPISRPVEWSQQFRWVILQYC